MTPRPAAEELQSRSRPPLASFHAHGRVRRLRGSDHRARRRLLPRGLERQAVSRRAGRALRGADRLLVRRRGRAGGARADEGAAVLHELVVRASAGDRARARGRAARAGRPEPRVLRLGRLGGGRVGVEARTAVPRGPRRAPLEGDRAPHRVPRHDDGRALDQRHRGDQERRSSRSCPRRSTSATRTATTGPRRRPRSSSRRSCSTTSSRRSSPRGRRRSRW